MTLSIIDSSDKVPGAYLEVLLGVGARSASDSARKLLCYGNKTSSGTATVETIYAVASVDDARTLFGAGSELFCMCSAVLEVWPTCPLYAIPVTASGGTAATRTLVFTGPATAAGTITVEIFNKSYEVAFASGDTATAIVIAVEAKLDQITDLPVLAAIPVAGSLSLTARHAGPRGNDIRYRVTATAGAGVTITNSSTTITGGATSDDPQTALDTAAPAEYKYHVSPYPDSTQNAKFKTHVDANAAPTVGIREYFVFGAVDTQGNTTTISLAVNSARGRLAWLYNSWSTPALLAARMAARIGRGESSDVAVNLDGTVLTGEKPPASSADWPLHTEMVTALNNGYTPLGVTSDGYVTVTRAITNRSRDTLGNPDYAVLDLPEIAVPDYVADDLELNFSSEFTGPNGGFKLGLDDTDDTSPSDPQDGMVTPKQIKDWIVQRLKRHEKDGLITGVDASIPNLTTEVDSVVSGRVNSSVPVTPVKGFHQFAAQVRQSAG